jgi:hypothetical protein
MPTAKFDMIFNRFSHIVPVRETSPRLLLDHAIAVPVGMFQEAAPPVRYVPSPTRLYEVDGYIDKADLEPGRLVISGWGPWTGSIETHELEVSVLPAASGPPRRSVLVRADLPAATRQRVSALNGFSLSIPLATDASSPALCVVAHDARTGKRTLLQNPPNLFSCPRANEAHG